MKQKPDLRLLLILIGFVISGFLIYAMLGPIGDSKGPGWKDLLQGGFVFLWMIVATLVVVFISRRKRKPQM